LGPQVSRESKCTSSMGRGSRKGVPESLHVSKHRGMAKTKGGRGKGT